jgi:hypothetical protein
MMFPFYNHCLLYSNLYLTNQLTLLFKSVLYLFLLYIQSGIHCRCDSLFRLRRERDSDREEKVQPEK